MDYTTVTEAPGVLIRREALSEMYSRYAHAARYAAGRDVLEIACGAGQGLGLLRATARTVVAGDFNPSLAARAHAHYQSRVPVLRLDAQQLPFQSGSFDTVLLYEAIYYLARAAAFAREARRLLRPGGSLLVCTDNRERAGFNPSPFSTSYPSAEELRSMLTAEGFSVEMFGAFTDGTETMRDCLVTACRRAAIALHLVPKTMKGKALLKRLFYGRLVEVPAELTREIAPIEPLVPLAAGAPARTFRIIYAIGRLA